MFRVCNVVWLIQVMNTEARGSMARLAEDSKCLSYSSGDDGINDYYGYFDLHNKEQITRSR